MAGTSGKAVAGSQSAVAACTFEIRAKDTAIQLFPAGAFKARDGRPKDVHAGHWYIDGQVATRLIAKAAALATDLVIDYEHQTLNSAENGRPAPAAAWFKGKALEWREGLGLFATQVDWTKNAVAMIAGKEYRYLSPVFSYEKQTGEVLELHHVGLTNFPALDGMSSLPALAAARFSLSPTPKAQRNATQLVDDIRRDIAALKSRQAQRKIPAVELLDETALAVCHAMNVSPEDYLAAMSELH
ncbi:MAG: phage protease [Gammaproteobacteria bacterium]|jgi:phage I-like protein|uniref:phage protease n=1 Tax=Stutzerimonas xanthomarina TaxID=271420 RepID=UPI00190A85A9|nr:phage protease [Stutzerimonas xanthomarina]MBU0810702.1 phage protease [Gammaproteobacteria bacterium]MBU0853342.1 phage protease [Gammaproteobacteria bacterium]MBU1300079.1 phage protease [Gammaproteobacteria bacterium]MBU1458251.1 phage protease [Gammaproteobacteria bacterium]MBU1771605.1 phage protease [Gammaproteobacteria bacterium]